MVLAGVDPALEPVGCSSARHGYSKDQISGFYARMSSNPRFFESRGRRLVTQGPFNKQSEDGGTQWLLQQCRVAVASSTRHVLIVWSWCASGQAIAQRYHNGQKRRRLCDLNAHSGPRKAMQEL
jgi:hypothetical protein